MTISRLVFTIVLAMANLCSLGMASGQPSFRRSEYGNFILLKNRTAGLILQFKTRV